MSKRSTNFMGSRATVARKASTPSAIIATCRRAGMSDYEITAFVKTLQAKTNDGANKEEDHHAESTESTGRQSA